MALAQLVLAMIMVFGFQQSKTYLAFALLSPIMMIGSYVTDLAVLVEAIRKATAALDVVSLAVVSSSSPYRDSDHSGLSSTPLDLNITSG
ncbi:MAG TPA: hypothetical protein VJT72_17390 [Pseudonocardiaceae bacterium]|nr:hypothetical protein [Pseudonocardiaceae bacterium]